MIFIERNLKSHLGTPAFFSKASNWHGIILFTMKSKLITQVLTLQLATVSYRSKRAEKPPKHWLGIRLKVFLKNILLIRLMSFNRLNLLSRSVEFSKPNFAVPVKFIMLFG